MRITVLHEPSMPSRYSSLRTEELFQSFPWVELLFQDVKDILENGILGEVFWNSHGEIYPYEIEGTLYEYLSDGGGFLHLGGVPFETAVVNKNGEWIPVVRTFGESRDDTGFGPLDQEFDFFRAKLGMTVYTPPGLEGVEDSLKITFSSRLLSGDPLPLTVPPRGLNIAASAQMRLFQPHLDLKDHRAYMARPLVRETIHTAGVVSPVGKKTANIMHLVKAWGNPYRKSQEKWLSPWALYCGEADEEFPKKILETMLNWLECPVNLKEPELGFASIHPGEETDVICGLTGPLPAGWKIRASVSCVAKEQWLSGEAALYEVVPCETAGNSAKAVLSYCDSAMMKRIRFELLDTEEKVRDYTESAVVCWRPETLTAPKVSANGTYFDIRDERKGLRKSRWVIGTNWQDRHLFAFSFHNPNPDRIAEDALDMAEAGILFVRPHYFMPGWFRSVPGQVYEEGFGSMFEEFEKGPFLSEKHMRAMEAHIMLFCSAGLVFMPSVYTNPGNIMGSPSHWMGTSRLFVVPELIEQQKMFAGQIMERFGSIQGISWDLDNEPNEGIDQAGRWLVEHKKIWGATDQMVGIGLFGLHNNMLLGESADWHSDHGKPKDIFHTGKPFLVQEAHYPAPCTAAGEDELEWHLNQGIALTLLWGGSGFMPWNWNMSYMNWRYRGGWVDFWDLHLGVCVHADGTPRNGRNILKNWSLFLEDIEFDQSGSEQAVFVYPHICLQGKGSFEYLDLLYQKRIRFRAVNDEDLADCDLSHTKLLIFPLYGLGYRESSWEKAVAFADRGGIVWAHNDNLAMDERGVLVRSRKIPEKTQIQKVGAGEIHWCLGWNIDKDKNSDFDPDMVELGVLLDRLDLLRDTENVRRIRGGKMGFSHVLDDGAVMLSHEWNSQSAKPEKNVVNRIEVSDNNGVTEKFWTNGRCPAILGELTVRGAGAFFAVKKEEGAYFISAQDLMITGDVEHLKLSWVDRTPGGYRELNVPVRCRTEGEELQVTVEGWQKEYWILLERVS